MENAIWNNKTVVASEISKNYKQEKEIRKASGHKELCCPDPDCEYPILRYCHGEKKVSYFAHLNNCQCDYANFDKENTSLMRAVKLKIYENFRSRGYNVQMDAKIVDKHYTHLVVILPNQKQIAIELGTQRITANRMDYLTSAYEKKGVQVKWLVISNEQTPVKESGTFFMKRYQLNESKNKDVLILNWDATELTQYIEDKKQHPFFGFNYPDIYFETSTLDALDIEDEELSIKGFQDRFQLWLKEKEKAFQKRLLEFEEKRKQEEKQAEEMQRQRDKEKTEFEARCLQQLNRQKQIQTNFLHVSEQEQTISRETLHPTFLSSFDQQSKQVCDQYGRRWIKCEICGKIATIDEFRFYGGPNHINLGECNECTRNNK